MGKMVLLSFAWLVLSSAAIAQSLFPLQPHPEDVAWPTMGWETGDLPEGSTAEVQRLMDEAMALTRDDVMGETRAIVVIHNGRLVAERYGEGFGPDTKQMSWSLAKSVTHGLVGRAVQLGLIEDIDDPMPTPFPEDDPRSTISWRDWLLMTDGLDYGELNEPRFLKNDAVQMMFGTGKGDVATYMAEATGIAHEPGQVWNYSTGGYHLIGWALDDAFGTKNKPNIEQSEKMSLSEVIERIQDDSQAATESSRPIQACDDWNSCNPPVPACSRETFSTCSFRRLIWADYFYKFGMDAQPEFDPAGTYLGGSNIWASAHDFAKFGYLYLRDGVWEGQRLLPEGWVDFARTPGPDQDIKVYGAGFWLALPEGEETTLPRARKTPPFDVFAGNGSEGQTISIVPSRDLVIVRLGLMPNNNPNWNALFEWNQQMARTFPEVELSSE